jgi:hypothetical protein
MRIKTNLIKFCIPVVLFILIISCAKDVYDEVPYVDVYLELDLTSELANMGVGIVVSITQDSTHAGAYSSIINYHSSTIRNVNINQKIEGNGIILYRKGLYEFVAYDITCTYRAKEDYCALSVDGSTLPTCPCCGSIFMLDAEGLPDQKAKAEAPLHEFSTSLTNNGTRLIISN